MPPSSVTAPPRAFEALLAAARRREPDALDELFERFYPRVKEQVHLRLDRDLRRSRPWLRAHFSTGDVVQEVFRSVLKDLGSFAGRTEDAFAGYLYMVVRNRLLDAIRHHEAARRDGRRNTADPDEGLADQEQRQPAHLAASAEERELFQRALATLDERRRLLLRARFEEHETFEELAEQLGYSSPSAARRAFFAAQAELAVRLKELDVG